MTTNLLTGRKPLTDEMMRILRACGEGALWLDHRGNGWRWKIIGGQRPESRARKLLIQRGYIGQRWEGWGSHAVHLAFLTDLGRAALEEGSEE